MTLSLTEQADGLTGGAEYNTDLFDAETNRADAGAFSDACWRAIVANPDEAIGRLPLLMEAERRQLLTGMERPRGRITPHDQCVHHLFAEQARRTPDAVAVVFGDRQWTYRELDERAGQLARHLRQLGVGPETRVGLCATRSLEMVAGLYAIHRAGGAYVPMDPAYPKDRLAFMLEDAQIPVLLTQQFLLESLPETTARIVCLDQPDFAEDAGDSGNGETELAAGEATPENLAYVIYTSGSTGKPKGVMVRHRNAVNFFTGMDAVLGREPGVWLAVTSISFDISVLELFWTLTRGFKVVIHGDEAGAARLAAWQREGAPAQAAPPSVAEEITKHGVTHLQCTPSLAGIMLENAATREALGRVKCLLLGGEPLPPSLAERLAGAGELFNMYGPTETTVWSTAHPVTRNQGAIAIGRPLANTEIYIVDKYLQPTPIGVPGELLIGGAGVARGYLNRPELTAERFIPNPFHPQPEAPLYRTGDLARYRADGTIEFCGRLDHQVKIRGFRIELGEIEAALRQHPKVKESVVTVWEPAPGDKRLAGYLVAPAGPPPQPIELRRFLQGKLPEYMVPAAFVCLAALPLTPNGKVDRKALPVPDGLRASTEAGFAPAKTELERAIAAIWQELLHVEQVGLRDNFFDLGGHSLLIVEAHARIRERLGVEFPVIRLFQFPTISGLARFLSEDSTGGMSWRRIQERAQRQRRAFGLSPARSKEMSL